MTLKTRNVPIKRWWDIWAALFILAAITLVSLRLWVTEWTSDLYILVYLTFIAAVTGIALGYSKFPAFVAALFSAVYGVFFTVWLFGTTVEVAMGWRDRILTHLWWRFRLALDQFSAGEAVADPILFLVLMALLLWMLGFATAFILIRRRSIWPALIPLGLTLFTLGHYDQDLLRNTRFLMAFLFFALLLIARITFIRYREKWEQEGIHTTYEIKLDFAKAMLALVSILLLISWLIPLTPQQTTRYSELWSQITRPWKQLRDQLSDIFVPENNTNYSANAYYGESMTLGNGSPASEEVLFTIQVEQEDLPDFRNYWRARSYDTYQENDWSNQSNLPSTMLYPETFSIKTPEWQGGENLFFTFTTNVSRVFNVYTTGVPTWISRPVEVTYQPLGNGEEDLIALTADPPLTIDESYQVEAWINVPTISNLRTSKTDYPTWLDRYLTLPEDFSPSIIALAEEITAELDNPYDKANAITQHLRTTIEYARTIPELPASVDPLEWFLFDGQTGFCNYYASAQVLMLRAAGVPARIAVGYAEGELDSENNTRAVYTVRKKDAHAWPEVYFMDYGWVIFEPTVSQPPVILPVGEPPESESNTENPLENEPPVPELPNNPDIIMDDLPDNSLADDPENAAQPVRRVQGAKVIWTLLILFLVALVITIVVLVRPTYFKLDIDPLPVLLERALIKRNKNVPQWLQHWSFIAQLSTAEKAYLQLGRSIRWLGQEINPAETPLERAQTVTNLLPDALAPVEDIISEYQLDKFSNHIVNEDRAKNAARTVRELTFNAILKRLFQVKRKPQDD